MLSDGLSIAVYKRKIAKVKVKQVDQNVMSPSVAVYYAV